MTDTTGPRADACIDALPGWQQAIRREVRQLVHAAGPQVTETIKRTSPPLLLEGCIPLGRGHRPRPRGDHHRAAMPARPAVPWPSGTAKQSPRPLIAMFRRIIASDRVGGWRELKRQADPR